MSVTGRSATSTSAAAGAQSLDWPALMRLGIRGLGLRPAEFWALTPAELLVLLGEGSGSAPMGRARLEELAKSFPDRAADTAAADTEKDETHGE